MNVAKYKKTISKEFAAANYGHCHGSKIWRKIIADNRIKFQTLKDYVIVAIDIETYNETRFDIVPTVDNLQSHIGLIAMSFKEMKDGVCVSESNEVLVYDRDYQLSYVDGVSVSYYKTE
jgi:hypothetical protein